MIFASFNFFKPAHGRLHAKINAYLKDYEYLDNYLPKVYIPNQDELIGFAARLNNYKPVSFCNVNLFKS